MKNKLKSIFIPLILCGFWGTFIYLLGNFIFTQSRLTPFFFYPVLFTGITAIVSVTLVLSIFIYTGGLVTGIPGSIFDSDFFLWFFWGAWTGLGVCLITIPVFNTDDTEEDFETLSELDEFKSEVRQILSELNQLDSRFS
jgi:hypothetical protein